MGEDITCLRPEQNHRVAAATVQPLWTNAEWKELQREDPNIVPIWTRLAKGEEKPRWNEMSEFSLATKAYWKEWQRLVMKDGVIYRKWESSYGAKVHTQVLVPTGKRKEILQQAHSERWTSHLDVKRTVVRLHERYFWHDMGADVRSWLAKCGVCVKAKGPGGRTRKNPMTIARSGTPFERIAIDMYGPLPETARGNSKIQVITCYFTKWVEAYALPDETAETVAEALVYDLSAAMVLLSPSTAIREETSKVRCSRWCADCWEYARRERQHITLKEMEWWRSSTGRWEP